MAAVSESAVDVALALAAGLSEPLLLLWVLITPRGGSTAGRYQSPSLSFDEIRETLLEYRDLFEQDGRSNLWIHGRNPLATIVLDAHDVLYTYGPEDEFIDVLTTMEFTEGSIAIPSPHAHEYHAEFDRMEREFAQKFDWRITALRAEDESS